MSSNPKGGESGDQLTADALAESARQFDSEALLSPQLRAALRSGLAPSGEDTERIRRRLWSAISTGVLPPSVHRVDIAIASRASGLKAGVTAIGHTLTTKLMVSSLVLAGAVGVVAVAPHKTTSLGTRAVSVTARSTARSTGSRIEPGPRPEPITEPASEVQAVPTPLLRLAAAPIDAPAAANAIADGSSLPGPGSVKTRFAEPGAQRAQRSGLLRARRPHSLDTASSLPLTAAAVQDAPETATSETPPAPSVTPVQPTPALNAELVIVHAASAALARHDPQSALESVSRYMTQYPQGALRAEVDALRVMALCLAHRSDAASERDGFLREHVSSALATRVLRACAQSH